MATVHRRGKTWWVDYRVRGKRVQRSLHTTNGKVARDKLKEIEYQLATKRLGLPSKTPVRELLADYCSHMRAHRKHKSAESDIGRLRKFFEACPVPYLEELTPGAVQEYLDRRILSGEIGPKTANEYRVILHTLVEYAIKFKGFISGDPQFPNPIKRVQRFRVSARDIRFLTLPQIREQLEALEPWPQIRAMVATYIYAGLRRAEALWLTLDDVKLRSSPPLLHVRAKEIRGEFWEPKTKQNRVVPISHSLHTILAEWALQKPTGTPWFFPSPEGCRYDEDNFSQKLRRIQKRVGLPWTCLDFRHTFGSQLVQKGETLYKISKLMGNSPDICRKHYAALVPEDMAETVEFGTPGRLGRERAGQRARIKKSHDA